MAEFIKFYGIGRLADGQLIYSFSTSSKAEVSPASPRLTVL
jgi:hypothetical protein